MFHREILSSERAAISVTAFGETEISPFQVWLESIGVPVINQGERWVVLTDDYLREELEVFNRKALSNKHPWMLVLLNPNASDILIGPIFIPGKTGCWECLRHRLQGKHNNEYYQQQKQQTRQPSTLFLEAILSIAATEAKTWIVDETNPNLEGKVVTFNTLTLKKRSHMLVRRPQCPHCGEPKLMSTRQSAPLVLQNCKKSFTTDGGHRSLSPEQTLKRFEHHISPITGIISLLEQTPNWKNDQGLAPSYVSVHNFGWAIPDDFDCLGTRLHSNSSGKGKSDIQARVSALGEAIERYAGVFQGDEARIRSKFHNLSGALHPNDCMLFSQQQLENREQWNSKNSLFAWVPEPFDQEMEIDWSPIWSLTDNKHRYIPTAYCYYGYAQAYNVRFTRADSNGCATGNTIEEAILQAFMELVERDCVALWWYNRLKKPAVDLASFDELYIQQLTDYYEKQLNRNLWVLDITNDLNIPAFAAISCRKNQESQKITLGFGAHFDPKIAMLRALTEINQSLPIAIMAEQGKTYYQHNRELHRWLSTATLENQPYLTLNKTVRSKIVADYPKYESDDLYTDVMNCVKIAQAKGLETLVLDQTRPDIGLSAVKVIVPGLRHFWPRFERGRLYDVPVQMGWLNQPLTEEQLNPQAIFL